MRLLKKFVLFITELIFLFMLSLGFRVCMESSDSKFAPFAFVISSGLIFMAVAWFRRKREKWSIAADATVWLARRSWRRLHPRRAKYLRILQQSFLWFPSLCSALVLFFFPVASHIVYSGSHLTPHYHFFIPLNWLIIKSPERTATWVFFSDQGAARYGFTPIWFNRSMPSSAIFFTSDPEHAYGWSRTESELTSGHTTHVAVRQFQLGMITATCYEYRHTYSNALGSPSSIFTALVFWETDCSTKPNGIDYNLRTSFFGHRDDLPAFYDLLNSATPAN